MKAARIAIEKNYAQVSNGFSICCLKEGSKIAKTNPISFEELQVCRLLTNCYICFDGNQAAGGEFQHIRSYPASSQRLPILL
jgi:hypothetical protein